MSRKSMEDILQAELIARLNEWGNFKPFADYMKWVFAVPNGGGRSKSQGHLLKMTGTKSGVHDIILPWPTADYGLASLEMKAGKGKTSDNQDDFSDFLVKTGSRFLVTNSVDEAERYVIRHMLQSLKSPEFGIFEATDSHPYYFTDIECRNIGYEQIKPSLFSGDPTIQQKHAILLTRKVLS